jgi:hypothetical protein
LPCESCSHRSPAWDICITHWQLADGAEVEILDIIDDHSRLLVGATARRVFKAGDVGRLHHIGIGQDQAGTRVLMLIRELNIRIISEDTGELIRELTLDPGATGRGPTVITNPAAATATPAGAPNPRRCQLCPATGVNDVARHHIVELRGFEPLTPSMRTRCATGLRHSPENFGMGPHGPTIRVAAPQLARRCAAAGLSSSL